VNVYPEHFAKRGRQAIEVLLATSKPLRFKQIKERIVGITNNDDEWELAVALGRLVDDGRVRKTRDDPDGHIHEVYEIPLLERLAMLGENPPK